MYNKRVAFADVTQWQSVRFPSRIRGFDSRHLLHKQGNPIYCVYASLKTLYIGLFMFRFILNRSYITLFVTNRVTKILPDRFRLSKACPPFSRGCGASPPAPTGNAVGFLSFRLRRGCGQGLCGGPSLRRERYFVPVAPTAYPFPRSLRRMLPSASAFRAAPFLGFIKIFSKRG